MRHAKIIIIAAIVRVSLGDPYLATVVRNGQGIELVDNFFKVDGIARLFVSLQKIDPQADQTVQRVPVAVGEILLAPVDDRGIQCCQADILRAVQEADVSEMLEDKGDTGDTV